MIDEGADVNAVDSGEHFTALMMAAAEGNSEVVKVLLAEGADRTMKDIDGDGALEFAREKNHTDVIELLLNENKEKVE